MRLLTLTIVILFFSACTTVPEQLEGPFPEISPVRVEPGVYGSNVRWGGVIMSTEVLGNRTCFEVLSRVLDKHMRPLVEDQTNGRFIACKQGFHDPAVFTNGREVTLTGHIQTIEVRPLKGFEYRYPVLDVDTLVLWERRRNVVVYRGFHDPWGWGWGRPYWGFHSHWRHPLSMHGGGRAEMRTLLPDPSIVESGN